MKLSILICSVNNRVGNFLSDLFEQINSQCVGKDVEVLWLIDNKVMTVGEKRNKLIEMATGEYITFVDDDDKIAIDYVDKLLLSINDKPSDVICFKAKISINGWVYQDVLYSKEYENETKVGVFYRKPNHLMCWKSSIAKHIKYHSINCGEDTDWANRIHKNIKTETLIDDFLYYYDFNDATSETQRKQWGLFASKDSELSIVIPVYNQLEYTKQVLEDIKKNILTKHEIIIVDDWSTDGTKEYLENLSEVAYYRNEKNVGVTKSWNMGISLAKHKYVLVINNDILFSFGLDKKLINTLESDSNNYIVWPLSTRWDKVFEWQPFYNSTNICWWCWMTTKDHWDKIWPIDERLKIWFNDDYLFMKTISSWGKVAVCPWMVHHFESKTVNDVSTKARIQSDIQSDMNVWWYICKENNRPNKLLSSKS